MGRKVYVLEQGRRGRKEDLVDLFDSAAKEALGGVVEQDTYFEEWLESIRT